MPTVNIDGDASGAIAACAAAQAAIDALHGKTVNVDINVREGGGGGMGAATRGMQDFGNAADRAGRSAQGMSDHLGRSADHARGMGDHMQRAGSALERSSRLARSMADETERAGGHMAAIAGHAEVVRGAISSGASGMRSIGSGAAGAQRDMRQLESGASRAGLAVRGVVPSGGVGGGAIKNAIIDMHKLSDGTYGVAEGMRAIGSAQKAAGSSSGGGAKPFSWAGVGPNDFEYTGGKPEDRSGRTNDAAGGRHSPVADGMAELRRSADAASGNSGGGGVGGLLGKLDELPSVAAPSARSLMGVGMGAGIATLGMGALSAAVAGVGLAGVAEDFAHNNQLMHGGEQAVRGFNRAFTEMRGATSAAGMPEMGGVKSSFAGVGKELASIGAANIGPVLNDVSSLGNQATQAMQKLAPSIGPATQGLTALAGAVIGAFGDSGPAVTSFANTVTQAAPGLRALTSDAINTAGAIGNFTAGTLGGVGSADHMGSGLVDVAPAVGDLGRSNSGSMDAGGGGFHPFSWMSNRSFSPLSAAPAGHDMFGNPTAPTGGAKAAAAPGAFDPSKPFSGTLPDGTVGTGTGAAPKAPRPPGPSPDAAWAKGMTGAQVLTAERGAIGLGPVGSPQYSGNGAPPAGLGQPLPGAAPPAWQRGGAAPPRVGGPGSTGGGAAMAPSVASGLGVGGGGGALGSLMTGGMQSSLASGGAATGQAMVQHVQKAVHSAAPAAASGGAALGGAIGSGMAAGTSSSMTVTDTVMVKHVKHLVEIAAGALGIHSPSKEFDYLGRMTWAGFGQGSERASQGTFGAVSDHMGGVLSAAQDQARNTSLDYDGSSGVTVSVPKSNQAMQYSSPLANQNIEAHNARAAALAAGRENAQRSAIGGMTHDERRDQLLQNRASNHERALANLGVGGRARPTGDVNPFAADQANAMSRRNGLTAVINPFHQSGLSGAQGAGSAHGQAMAQGVTVGLNKGAAGAQAGAASFAKGVQSAHKKTHGISSPATVWAADGMNLAAGVGVGVTAGTSVAVGAVGGMSNAVQAAGQYLSNQGLMVGYSWAQNVVTGVQQQIKNSDYQALGLPKLNQAAEMALAATGLLSAGSGAESYKTPGNAPGLVVLPAASGGGNQTITFKHELDFNGVMQTIATEVTLDHLGQVTDAISRQQAA